MECIAIVVVVLGIFVAMVVYYYHNMTQAEQRYLASLEQLKRDPHNPDLREQTLQYGRRYAQLVRNTMKAFDEVALMNDINAACARAGSKVKVEQDGDDRRGREERSIDRRLEELERLRRKAAITDDEYRSRRKAILDEI
jgi:hypothetical protein